MIGFIVGVFVFGVCIYKSAFVSSECFALTLFAALGALLAGVCL